MNAIKSKCIAAAFLLICVAILPLLCAAQNIHVTLLGTGSPQPRIERFGPSILVVAGQKKLLFDCGRGATQRLEQIKIPFADVDALFLTHLHSDHVVGIPDLWLTGWARGRKVPLRVWGPTGTKEMMFHLAEAYRFDIRIRQEDDKLPAEAVTVVAKDIEQGTIYDGDGIKVTAFAVDHGLVKPAFGYRIDFGGRSVVLSGDTRFSENLIRFSMGSDLLIHEVIDPEAFRRENPAVSPERFSAIVGHHTTAEQAGTVFARVKPKLAVYSHIVPWNAPDLIQQTRKTYSGSVELGEDLMSFDIGEKVTVHRTAVEK